MYDDKKEAGRLGMTISSTVHIHNTVNPLGFTDIGRMEIDSQTQPRTHSDSQMSKAEFERIMKKIKTDIEYQLWNSSGRVG